METRKAVYLPALRKIASLILTSDTSSFVESAFFLSKLSFQTEPIRARARDLLNRAQVPATQLAKLAFVCGQEQITDPDLLDGAPYALQRVLGMSAGLNCRPSWTPSAAWTLAADELCTALWEIEMRPEISYFLGFPILRVNNVVFVIDADTPVVELASEGLFVSGLARREAEILRNFQLQARVVNIERIRSKRTGAENANVLLTHADTPHCPASTRASSVDEQMPSHRIP